MTNLQAMQEYPVKHCYSEVELMEPGHLACPGCGGALAMRLALKALGEKTILVIPACCWAIIPGPFPYSNMRVPIMHTAFETAASAAAGVRAALEIRGETDISVVAWAGDGGTFDIGLQALSGAAERQDDIIYVCYDNEAYMNTGIQRSSATPELAWTTTTPEQFPKEVPKKDIEQILAGHNISYIATTSVAFPHDLMEKLQKAKSMKGTRFIHILSPCPPGWKIPSNMSIEITRLATECNVFPLYEIFNGSEYRLNYEAKSVPIQEYIRPQYRFHHLTADQMIYLQQRVDANWKRLCRLFGRS